MHRAERSSSKICRTREVEKAQELHRKKIDGVKSYLCGKIPKPAVSRSSTSFRLRPARSMTGSFSSVGGEPPLSAGTSLANSGPLRDVEQQICEGSTDILILDGGVQCASTSQQNQLDEFQSSLAKMDEFREVAPIPGLGSVVPAKHPANKLAPPPAGSRKISMNASFRARRLKEIKADNADVVDRIRKSVSHYRNDDLQREWQQNLSYLSSISEFPVSVDSLTSPKLGHKHHNAGDDTRSCFGPSPRRSSFLKPSPRAETLPSIPVVAHPIKSIPTSPKKLQLNMSPAFRSLRKAMPQHPSLPPISSPHSVLNAGGASDFSSGVNNTLLPSPSGRNSCPNSPRDEDFTENRMGRGLPYRSSTAIAATKFIGDLHGKQAENEVSGDAKYQLLKTGRFVGGTYLVLTVFCGDGVANPYGFDVFAYHRELKCEYKLSITKEMTHELLDKSSSSSLAAETAAAAGTNLSMQEIARNICDHINFALLGTDQGEMIFLTPSVERKSEQAMRFDASPTLVAFCLHQAVELGETESDEIPSNHGSSSRLIGSKRKRHVFASTCPPTSYPASGKSTTTGLMIRFHITEGLPPSRCTSPLPESSFPSPSTLKVDVSVDELYSILFDSCRDQNQILSVDRVVITALRHLHIIAVPSGDNSLRNELIVNAHVNTLLQPCPSRPVGTTSLERKRLRQQLPHSTSQLLTQSIRSTILFQSGLVWRNTYLLAEVALDNAESTSDSWFQQRSQRQSIRDVDRGLVVSVFNSNSGRSSCRRLLPDNITAFLERLEVLSSKSTSREGISDQHTFAKELLTRLQLDVDLFGQEVIVFPALEHASNDNVVKGSDKVDAEVDSPEEHAREFPQGRTSWEEENISEGDESADSEVYDEDRMEEAAGLGSGIVPYDTDEEEEREEADASYSSYANQDDDLDVMVESFEDVKPHSGQEETLNRGDGFLALHEDVPDSKKEDSERSTRRSWRQGQKLDGRFCLLQGSSDDSGLAVRIAALGQLEMLPTSSVYRAI